jgi:hypothetical protein
MTTDADPDPEAAAAIAEAERIVTAAQRAARRRPRCWNCRRAMDLDVSGRYYHCTVPGCRASLLSVGAWAPWREPQD